MELEDQKVEEWNLGTDDDEQKIVRVNKNSSKSHRGLKQFNTYRGSHMDKSISDNDTCAISFHVFHELLGSGLTRKTLTPRSCWLF